MDELHELRSAQNPKQTFLATAQELQASHPEQTVNASEKRLQRARVLAPFLDNPLVANAKNEAAALSIVTRQMEADIANRLAVQGVEVKTKHTLIHGSCVDWMKTLEPNIDCILTDPPYGMDADKFGDAAQQAHTYEDTAKAAMGIIKHIAERGFTITKSDAHIWIFCDPDHFITIREILYTVGWTTWRTPVIWYKTSTFAHAPLHERGFRRNYEMIAFASKGNKPFGQVYADVFELPDIRNKQVAAQKPVDLYRAILQRSCLPGDTVLDPCCGSGTIFTAADTKNLTAIGIEQDDDAHTIANATLHNLGQTTEVKPEELGIDEL